MHTVIGNQITVHNPSTALRLWTRKNLELGNPEFVKKQRMGLWVGNTPKVIRLYEDFGEKLRMPFGCLREVQDYLIDGTVEKSFVNAPKVDFEGEIPLYDYQEKAVEIMIHQVYGILQSPAGSGKTQMGLAIASRLGLKTLWLTHTKDLLDQSMKRACQYFYAGNFGTITEGKVDIGRTVTFATIQTMCHVDLDKYRDEWDCIIVDECHRVAGSPTAVTMFSKVLNSLRARHKYGLSATVHRADGLIRATTAILGRVVYVVPDHAVEEKIMPVTVRPKGTGTQLPHTCLNPDGTLNYAKMIGWLVMAPDRTWIICEDLKDNRDHYCLILSERLQHLKILQAGLAERGLDARVITGASPKAYREETLERMRKGEIHFLLATYALAKDGLDIPRLDRLFLATPQKDYAVVVQSVGRIARRFPEKQDAIVFDYVDNSPFTLYSYKTRCRHYRKIGCTFEEEA